MKLKRIPLIIAVGAVAAVMANNFSWAMDDYGLKEVSLNRIVLAQGQEPCTTQLISYASNTSTQTGGTAKNKQQYYQYIVTNITRINTKSETISVIIGENTSGSIRVDKESPNIGTGVSASTTSTKTVTHTVTQYKIDCALGTRFYPCSPFWADV